MENIESLQYVNFNNKGEQVELELTEEFKAAIQILEKTNESLFITGKAGSGKSSLLNYFVQNTEKNVAILAFTGLAAINVGGETIHSFFKFPLGFIDEDQIKHKNNLEFKLKSLDVIIIDEISMTRADIIDAINKSLQVNRKSDKPFGGVQMVFVGDLYQLPPIVGNDIKNVYNKYYKTPYFFSANVFKNYSLPYVNLEKIHRQKDQKFINVLNSIRERKDLNQALMILNQHIGFSLKDIKDGDTICITTTNKKSQEINDYFLNKINSKLFRYECKVTGDFDEKSYPTDPILELKVGAKVMFIRNDYDKRYVNGDIGIILNLTEKEIIIKLRDSNIYLTRATWEKEKYTYIPSEEEGKKGKIEKCVVGTFTQFPIKLAWAITIHKSQGQTYNDVFIDFHNGTFTSGQAYVALSRCKSLDGMTLKRQVNERDIILDYRINDFYYKFSNIFD